LKKTNHRPARKAVKKTVPLASEDGGRSAAEPSARASGARTTSASSGNARTDAGTDMNGRAGAAAAGAVGARAVRASGGPEQKFDEAQIAVHWREEEFFRPPVNFVAQANLVDPDLINQFREENFPECFRH